MQAAPKHRFAASLLVLLSATCFAQQTPTPAPQPVFTPIPADRAAASYEIYSQLLPGDSIEWGDAKRSFWLLEDTTTAVPPQTPCATGGMMNPHQSIRAPEARSADFAELLADFDAHCHDAYHLQASRIHVKAPVHLLDEEARKRFISHVAHYLPPQDNIMQAPPTPDEFKGAAGMHRFTAVYFNRAHTLAMTQIGMYCGGLCGNRRWVILERKDGQWQILPWATSVMFS